MKIRVKMTRAGNIARHGEGIAELDLEEYLYGVVPAEIGEGSHGDALRAQAVAARTFAVRRVLSGVVVDDTARFQAYRAELLDCSPRSREAVADTAGVVLVYGGEVIDCYYSASNGGVTKRSGEVWGRDYPYYMNKADPWDIAARLERPKAASHGVGMSQVGCMWAAGHGVPWHEILAFYYGGAALAWEYGRGGFVSFGDDTEGVEGLHLHKLIFTENACYKTGRRIVPKGIMVHSTGADNPWLRRYVGPDDGLLGLNPYNNHWNQAMPSGRQVCVHGFIGKLADGTVATYQTLPWDWRGWHCGSGPKGSGNDSYISFEICEDGLADAVYFHEVYREAVELCVYLCGLYGLTEGNIICHSEGHERGIASNHGDVMHWFPRHGKSMDSFRAAIRERLASGSGNGSGGSGSNGSGSGLPGGNGGGSAGASGSGMMYRVRRSWADAASQKGAFRVLDYAKLCADENAGYSVFDESGKAVYIGKSPVMYTVQEHDTLWGIAARLLGSGKRYPEIMEANGLRSDVIRAGMVLRIPD